MSGVVNFLALTGAFFMLQVYDRVIPGRSVPTLVGLAIFAAMLFIFQGVLELIRSRLLMRIGMALDERMGGKVYAALMRLLLRTKLAGDGLQWPRDLDQVRSFLSSAGLTAHFDLPWMPLYLAICFLFHFWIGMTALAGAIILFSLTLLAEARTREPAKKANSQTARATRLPRRRARQARAVAGEQSLFEFRQQSRAGQKAQPEERIAQLSEEGSSLTEQRAAKSEEIKLIGPELDSIRRLWRQKLASIDRLTALERDAIGLEGEHGQLTASIAQARGRMAEARLRIIQVDQDLRKEVATELRDVQSKMSEFVERKVSAEDQLKRIDIRSPQDGVVHQLVVHTVGGVITPCEVIMLIVPVADELTVEARVAPQDIDQLTAGQEAGLKFSAFNQRVTPELIGHVSEIGADLSLDERSGAGFYTVRIDISRAGLKKLKGLNLAPGMPVEVFFSTGNRTMLSYLVKPLADQIDRAFREE